MLAPTQLRPLEHRWPSLERSALLWLRAGAVASRDGNGVQLEHPDGRRRWIRADFWADIEHVHAAGAS